MKQGRQKWNGLLLIGCSWACVVGCDGKETTSDGHVTGSVENGEFVTQYAASFCQGISGCCAASAIAFDLKSCESSLSAQANAALAGRLADPKIAFDADAATRCINAVHDATAACTDQDLFRTVDEPCNQVFRGTVTLGNACSDNMQCANADGQRVRCTQGVCSVEAGLTSMGDGPHAKLGERCAGTCTGTDGGWSCAGIGSSTSNSASVEASCWTNEGLYCGSAGLCAAIPNVGEACASPNYCPAGAYCSNKTCVAQVSSGSCASDSSACNDSSYCEVNTKQCTPKKRDGDTCDQDSECLGGECYGDRCRVWSIATPASCAGLMVDD